jgi:hypothetical protein
MSKALAPTTITENTIIAGFESLNKWNHCITTMEERQSKIPKRMVYQHNRARAAGSGFPTVLEMGCQRGLTDHKVAVLFGWTTGDYRFVNPIARGNPTTEFTDYPFLPHQMTKATFVLSRDDVLPYIQIMNSALSKLEPESSSQHYCFWRGQTRRPIPSSSSNNNNDDNNNNDIVVGSTFVLKGFTSVTRDRENALEFCTKTDGVSSAAQRTLLCIVESKSGRCLSKFSARSDEMEVLFPLDTTFEVVEPPPEDDSSFEQNQKAADQAREELQAKLPGAQIELIYVKEIEATEWA